MKSILVAACSVIFLLSCQNQAQNKNQVNNNIKSKVMSKESIHQFKVTDLSGNEFDFSSLKGKKVLVVNTASECGSVLLEMEAYLMAHHSRSSSRDEWQEFGVQRSRRRRTPP